MDLVNFIGMMEVSMKENGKIIWCKKYYYTCMN